MIIRMTIDVAVNENIYGFSEEEMLWLENEIFIGDGSLILHSNEIGDEIGPIKRVKNIQYIKEEKK